MIIFIEIFKIFQIFCKILNLKTNIFSTAYCLCPSKFSVIYGPFLGLCHILILAIFASKIRNYVLILQWYNLFELSIQTFRVDCKRIVHTVRSKYTALLWFGYYAAVHISGGLLPSVQRSAMANGILIKLAYWYFQ